MSTRFNKSNATENRPIEVLNIHIGKDSLWQMPADKQVASVSCPTTEVADIADAVHVALSKPLDFPGFDQAIVPGDVLALAVDQSIPALVEVVSAVVKWFCDRGVDAANIRIVLAGEGHSSPTELEADLLRCIGAAVHVERHDFDDVEKIAYVAANEESDPIYLNRVLVDADVVVPICCARPASALDYFGAFGLFPLLSNRSTRGEFYSMPRLDDPVAHAKLRSWAEQAAWWLGVVVGIEVIPAGQNQVAEILAGQLVPLEDAAQSAMASLWRTPVATSDLVVAVLEGSPTVQSWLGLARTLHTALRYVTANGTIVLATQLQETVGKGLGRLRDPHREPASIAKKLAADASDDAIAAAIILSATETNHVYLISNLRSETVESLGLGVIDEADELSRLIEQHEKCTIIDAAQFRSLELCSH